MASHPNQTAGNDPIGALLAQAQAALDSGQGEYLISQLAQAVLIDESRVSPYYQRALIQRAYQRSQRNDLSGAMADYQEAYRVAAPGQQQLGLQALIDQLKDRMAKAQAATVQAPPPTPTESVPPPGGYAPTQPAPSGTQMPGQASSSPYICPNCKQGVPANANNCPVCGYKLSPTQPHWSQQPTVKQPGAGRYIWMLVGFLLVIVLAALAYFFWPDKTESPKTTDQPVESVESKATETLPIEESADISITQTAAWKFGDDDGDGLTNSDELFLGTDPMRPDTDGDGCYDGQETGMGTDPLNADSDGDSLPDCSDPDPLRPPTPTTPPHLGFIAFHAGPGNGDVNDIFIMNADGSGVTRLTENLGDDRVPAWSPDGRQIAYQSNLDGDYELVILDLNSRQSRQVTMNTCNDYAPTWSPDGNRLAFYSDCDNSREIYTIGVNGSNRQQLTFTNGIYNVFPSWSPSGEILFASNREGGKYWIYQMDASGGNLRKLAKGCVASYSPDGSQIVYAEYCFDDGNISLMDANGSNQQVLDNVYFGRNPSWSPDGNKILLQSPRSGNFEIWTIDIASRAWTQLTNSSDVSAAPVWQPFSNR